MRPRIRLPRRPAAPAARPQRFAADPGVLSTIREAALPQSAGEWVAETAPDLVMSTIVGLGNGSLPLGLVDAAFGLSGSFTGRLGGAALAVLTGNPTAARTAANWGGFIGGFGVPMLVPNPVMEGIRRRQEQQLAAEQAVREQGAFEQGILAGAQNWAGGARIQGIDGVMAALYPPADSAAYG